jgi:thioesterase domain-containing protein
MRKGESINMSDITKRISNLSPEKRRLLEISLREKGVNTSLSENDKKQSGPTFTNPVRLPNSPLIEIRTRGSKAPFFFAHPLEGNILCYLDLVGHANTGHPFYGLQAPGLEGECEPYTKIEQLASLYIEAIKAVHNDGPYLVGGWSMGGIVAYEMAQQLLEQGQKVPLLVVMDSTCTNHSKNYFKEEIECFLQNIPGLKLSAADLNMSSDSYSDYFSDKHVKSILELAKKSGYITSGFGFAQVERYFKLMKTNIIAHLRYRQRPYGGRIVYFKASENINYHDASVGWGDLTAGDIEIHNVPGDHFSMMREPNVQVVADKLRECLEAL